MDTWVLSELNILRWTCLWEHLTGSNTNPILLLISSLLMLSVVARGHCRRRRQHRSRVISAKIPFNVRGQILAGKSPEYWIINIYYQFNNYQPLFAPSSSTYSLFLSIAALFIAGSSGPRREISFIWYVCLLDKPVTRSRRCVVWMICGSARLLFRTIPIPLLLQVSIKIVS